MKWFALALIILVAVGGGLLALLSGLSDRQRLAAVADIEKAAAITGYGQPKAEGTRGLRPSASTETSDVDDGVVPPRDITEGWARLFERLHEELRGNASWNVLVRWPRKFPCWKWSDDERAAVEGFVDSIRGLLDEIHALAALGGPVADMDEGGYWGQTNHCGMLRVCLRLMHFEATSRALREDREGAAKSVLVMLQLGQALADEPFVTAQQFRIYSVESAKTAFSSAFAPGTLPPDAAGPLQNELARIDGRDALAAILAVHFHRRIEMRQANWKDRSLRECVKAEGWREGAMGWLWTGPLCRPLYNQDERVFAEITKRLIDCAHRPYYQARPVLKEIEADVAAMSFIRSYAKEAAPRLASWYVAVAESESVVHLMQLGIAVEAYYAEHSKYPASLSIIEDQIPGGMPLDPFSGEAFHYTPGEDTFLLYGVGRDCEDDGGSPAIRDGDVVWRAN